MTAYMLDLLYPSTGQTKTSGRRFREIFFSNVNRGALRQGRVGAASLPRGPGDERGSAVGSGRPRRRIRPPVRARRCGLPTPTTTRSPASSAATIDSGASLRDATSDSRWNVSGRAPATSCARCLPAKAGRPPPKRRRCSLGDRPRRGLLPGSPITGAYRRRAAALSYTTRTTTGLSRGRAE